MVANLLVRVGVEVVASRRRQRGEVERVSRVALEGHLADIDVTIDEEVADGADWVAVAELCEVLAVERHLNKGIRCIERNRKNGDVRCALQSESQ